MVKKKLRAVFYARVSTEEEKQLNALEKQIQENRDVIISNGWELIDEYIDEGKSGTTTKRRSDYKRMLEDMAEDKFDIVVCKDQDRLQRNTLDWYLFVDRLVTNELQLYFYLENKYFRSNEDALITGIKAIIAEEYSRNLSKKLNNANKRRIERALQSGEVSAMGNGKSLGYKIVDKKWVQVPEEIELCKIIWDKYEEFDSIRKVRDFVNDAGYRNSVGKPFTSESIARIIKNEKAKGVLVMGRFHHDFDKKKIVKRSDDEVFRVEIPELAYVSAERFDRVNAHLKSKTNGKRGKRGGSDPLSGKIFCSECGSVYWKHQSNGYYNWFCSQKYAKGDVACKGSGTVTTVKIRKIYAELTNNLEVNREAVKGSLLEWLQSLKNSLTDEKANNSTLKEIERQEKRKNKLTEAFMDEIISKEDYKAKYAELERSLEELKLKIQPVEENEDVKDIENVIANIDEEIDAYIQSTGFEDSKIDFLIEHTQRITVNGKHLIIELDLLAGAIITGKDFMLFVHSNMHYRVQITEYIVELKVA